MPNLKEENKKCCQKCIQKYITQRGKMMESTTCKNQDCFCHQEKSEANCLNPNHPVGASCIMDQEERVEHLDYCHIHSLKRECSCGLNNQIEEKNWEEDFEAWLLCYDFDRATEDDLKFFIRQTIKQAVEEREAEWRAKVEEEVARLNKKLNEVYTNDDYFHSFTAYGAYELALQDLASSLLGGEEE